MNKSKSHNYSTMLKSKKDNRRVFKEQRPERMNKSVDIKMINT
ncbi:hypothetical protein [Staphylococcus capitis]|nr:hypothetical protein [Staphylococcus capitis]